MSINKKIDLKKLILGLFDSKKEIHLHDIAQAADLSAKSSKNRRAIQRALVSLIENEMIKPQGQARARKYILKTKMIRDTPQSSFINTGEAFKDIPLSDEAVTLQGYLSQSIQARQPVGYNQDFLKSYEPNKSIYLSEALRSELLIVGRAENIVRPAGTYARNILNRLLIDLSWNSSRLEGNTYSLLETKRLIEFGESTEGKGVAEAQMILNHKRAIEYIIESASETKISSHEICSIHALLSENLLGDPGASGRIRELSVGISGTTYLPLENTHVLKSCFKLFIKKLNLIKDPFEQSFFALVHLSYLQAFEDVNKRTARLVANISLITNNLKPLSFIDVNQKAYVTSLLGVYEKNDLSLLRDLYVWAYKRSAQQYSALQQAMGEPNVLKLKYRASIQEIVRRIILEKTKERAIVAKIRDLIKALNLSEDESTQLFHILETEIMSLHEGNIARFKIRPSEFLEWKKM